MLHMKPDLYLKNVMVRELSILVLCIDRHHMGNIDVCANL